MSTRLPALSAVYLPYPCGRLRAVLAHTLSCSHFTLHTDCCCWSELYQGIRLAPYRRSEVHGWLFYTTVRTPYCWGPSLHRPSCSLSTSRPLSAVCSPLSHCPHKLRSIARTVCRPSLASPVQPGHSFPCFLIYLYYNLCSIIDQELALFPVGRQYLPYCALSPHKKSLTSCTYTTQHAPFPPLPSASPDSAVRNQTSTFLQ